MLFKSITRRASTLAIFGLLPAAFVVGETNDQVQLEKEGTQLIAQVEDVARDIHFHADRLQSFTRDNRISPWTHDHHLSQIKWLVNEGLRPALARLAEIRPQLPDWKRLAIDRMFDSARPLAADTNSAIFNRNNTRHLPIVLNAEYRDLIESVTGHAETLVKTSDAAGQDAETYRKAIEADLDVPQLLPK